MLDFSFSHYVLVCTKEDAVRPFGLQFTVPFFYYFSSIYILDFHQVLFYFWVTPLDFVIISALYELAALAAVSYAFL